MIHSNETPAVAVDTLIFTMLQGELSVLLLQIGNGAYRDKWALPGGLVDISESLDAAAHRVLRDKAGIEKVGYIEQLYSFGSVNRDTRKRSISVAYLSLVQTDFFLRQSSDYAVAVEWYPLSDLPRMAFDHEKIIGLGLARLQERLMYTNIAYSLLPKEFTLTQLQSAYESILGESLDKRNFRKKILSIDIVKSTGKQLRGEASRPAELFTFAQKKLECVDIL